MWADEQNIRPKSGHMILGVSVVAIVFILLLSVCSCMTAPLHYETALPECLEYSIASCRAAIVEDGMEAGLIHYIPVWGGGSVHCVVWIRDKYGKERIYDPSYRMHRTISKKAIILHRGEGLDLGIYATLLRPMKKTPVVASR